MILPSCFCHLRTDKDQCLWINMDHAAISTALHDVDFTGYAVIELATRPKQRTRPVRESLKTSRQFVRNTMGY